MSWAPLDEQETKAKAVLGDGAKFPKQKVDIQALEDKATDAFAKFRTGRDKLEELLQAVEDAEDAVRNGVKTVAAAYETDAFGLDEKKKNDAKKIKQAQQMFSAFFAQKINRIATGDKVMDELQKHLEQLGTYKGPRK